jgi:phosphoribosylamine--glycine ligase
VLASRGYPQKANTGDVIKGLNAANSRENTVVFHAGTARDDKGNFVTAGGRVLGVTATAENLNEALNRAYQAAGKISWEGMQYRRDIGK